MTDGELARFIGIAGKIGCAEIIAGIAPEKRAVYERMAQLENDVALWQAGVGPKPQGVLLDMTRPRRRRFAR